MSLTPVETEALLEAIREREEDRERRAILRAGLVAATILNLYRKPGHPPVVPQDFLARPKAPAPNSADEWVDGMRDWAKRHNARIAEVH